MPTKQSSIELAKEFSDRIPAAVFIVDGEGNLLALNQPAAEVLGIEFTRSGPIPSSEWTRVFQPMDENGNALLPESLPLVIAMTERRPTTKRIWIEGMDNVRRQIEVAAVPIDGQTESDRGAMAIFWEVD